MLPSQLSFGLERLCKFLAKDSEASLTFYGGEPLLKIPLIEEIMQNAPCKKFMLQTNGLLLGKLRPEFANRLSTILVSIDGDERLTDKNRGKGDFRKVIANLKLLKKNGFSGELIARMTVTEDTDILKQVKFLLKNGFFSFDAVHWQLDANFWNDFKARPKFRKWLLQDYNPKLRKLANYWVSEMQKKEKVLKLLPFVETMQDLLLERKSALRCGSGFANFTIQYDGRIIPCPVMVGMKEYYLGSISSVPERLRRIAPEGECKECKIIDFCGGRCLYSSIVQPWPVEGRKLVCKSVENLREAMMEQLPRVKRLLKKGKIMLKDFEHAKYQGPEIIP